MAKTRRGKRVNRPKKIKMVATNKGKVKKIETTPKNSNQCPVLMINHIPHGFYEEEMRKYFSQFGHVNRIRVARSVKTGRHKDFAFVEFLDQDVAEIAAEAMNNYLMFGKLLKCKIIPPKNVKRATFTNEMRKFEIKQDSKQKRSLTAERNAGFAISIKQRVKKAIKDLKELGIDFQFECPELGYEVPSSNYYENIIDPEETEVFINNKSKSQQQMPDHSHSTEIINPEVKTTVKKTRKRRKENKK